MVQESTILTIIGLFKRFFIETIKILLYKVTYA